MVGLYQLSRELRQDPAAFRPIKDRGRIVFAAGSILPSGLSRAWMIAAEASVSSPIAMLAAAASASGCHHPIPVQAQFQGTAQVAAQADVRGEVAIKLPAAADPGPMVASR